jgi:hypothetical protein
MMARLVTSGALETDSGMAPNYAFERTVKQQRYRLNVGRAAAQRER